LYAFGVLRIGLAARETASKGARNLPPEELFDRGPRIVTTERTSEPVVAREGNR
jgi:hypothetical protein